MQQVYLIVQDDYEYSTVLGVFSSLNGLRKALKKYFKESKYADHFDYRIISFMINCPIADKPLLEKRIISDGYPIDGYSLKEENE